MHIVYTSYLSPRSHASFYVARRVGAGDEASIILNQEVDIYIGFGYV